MFPVQTAIKALLSALPEKAEPFSGSEYPLPVHAAYLADVASDMTALSGRLSAFSGTDVKPLVDPILICAEAIESAQPDREKYFIPDRKVQDYVFMGSKWRAGWALVLGGNGSEQLIQDLQEQEFMVFTDLPGLPDTWDIGSRETSPVYFLQMMVRYGLTWGRIKPGQRSPAWPLPGKGHAGRGNHPERPHAAEVPCHPGPHEAGRARARSFHLSLSLR